MAYKPAIKRNWQYKCAYNFYNCRLSIIYLAQLSSTISTGIAVGLINIVLKT